MYKQNSLNSLSIVVPVYNNAIGLPPLLSAFQNTIDSNLIIKELILVNDASNDNSQEIIDRYQKSSSLPIKSIQICSNIGQHAATFEGVKIATGDYIITIDDDLQFLPKDMHLLLLNQEDSHADLIYGTPKHRQHSITRNIASCVALFLFHHVLGISKKATSFRLIKRALVEKIIGAKPTIVFIDGMLAKHKPKTSYVFVEHRERPVGKSGHNLIKQGWWTLKILCYYSRRY